MRRGAIALICAASLGLPACGIVTDRPPDSDSGVTANGEREQAKARAAQAAADGDPSDPAGWAEAIRAWITAAASGDRHDASTGEYSEEGKENLRRAVAAWGKYLTLEDPDRGRRSTIASRVVQAFVALGDLRQAARAQEIVAEGRKSAGDYAQLAVLAYQAGQTRKGDLAAAKAVELAPRNQRKALEGQLSAARKQAALLQG